MAAAAVMRLAPARPWRRPRLSAAPARLHRAPPPPPAVRPAAATDRPLPRYDAAQEAAEVRAATEAALLLSPSQCSQDLAPASQGQASQLPVVALSALATALEEILRGRGSSGLARAAAAQVLGASDGEAVDRAIGSLVLSGHAYAMDDVLYAL